MLKRLMSFIKNNSFGLGRFIAFAILGVLALIGVAIFVSVILLSSQLLTVKQQWKWAQIEPISSQNLSSRSVFIELEDVEKNEARFFLKSENPEFFPCWLRFRVESEQTEGFSVAPIWLRTIKYHLQLLEKTQDAQLKEELFLYVSALSNASSLPLAFSLKEIPNIDNISLREAFFGRKKSFSGTITISLGVPRNIDTDNLYDDSGWSPIRAFYYTVEFEPGIRFR
jgi:hypothetical protein